MVAPTRLYGRDRERALLRDHLSALLEENGGLILIGGTAGIGKTALVEDLASSAAAHGVHVLTGSCFDLETPPPFGVWGGIIDQLPSRPQPAGIRELLIEMAATQTTLAILEDLHWADPASLDLLESIGREAGSTGLLMIATYRDDEIRPNESLFQYLPTLVRDARAERLHLRPIDVSALRSLVADRYELPPAETSRLVDALRSRTEGNPFFVHEFLRTLEDEHLIWEDETGWRLADPLKPSIPQLVQAMIARRCAKLEDAQHKALAMLALIGQRPSLTIWQQLTGFDDATHEHCLSAAEAAGILEIEGPGPRVRFRHALVQEALTQQLPVPARQRFHEHIASLMMNQPNPDAETIAHHLLQIDNPAAADWLIRAARAAGSVFAERTAIHRYEQAVNLLADQPQRNVERAWLLCELASAYRHVGPRESQRRIEDAYALLPQAADPALEVIVRWNRARIRAFRNEPVLEELRGAVADYETLSPEDRQRVRESPLGFLASWGTYAQVLAGHGQYHEARDYAHRHLQESATPCLEQDHIEHAHAHYGLALVAAALSRPEEAREEFARARAHYREGRLLHGIGLMLDWEIDVVLSVYEPDEPLARRQHIAEMTALAGQSVFGAPLGLAADLLDGRWQELRERMTALLGFEVLNSYTYRFLAELDRLQGFYERAARQMARIMPNGPATEPGVRLFHNLLETQRIAADLALDRGALDEAEAWIEAHQTWLDWSDELAGYPRLRLLRARLAHLHAEPVHARKLAEEALDLASAPRQPLVQLESSLLLARLEIVDGCLDAAECWLSAATRLALNCDTPFELASCKLAAAEIEWARGHVADAGLLLEAAKELAGPLRAVPLLDRIAKLDQRMRAGNPTAALTPRQLEVLQFLATGLTNAQIADRLYLSPRTVDQHLRRIYAALDVSSRAAATRYALDHGLITEPV